jgi:hypothetical protein
MSRGSQKDISKTEFAWYTFESIDVDGMSQIANYSTCLSMDLYVSDWYNMKPATVYSWSTLNTVFRSWLGKRGKRIYHSFVLVVSLGPRRYFLLKNCLSSCVVKATRVYKIIIKIINADLKPPKAYSEIMSKCVCLSRDPAVDIR